MKTPRKIPRAELDLRRKLSRVTRDRDELYSVIECALEYIGEFHVKDAVILLQETLDERKP